MKIVAKLFLVGVLGYALWGVMHVEQILLSAVLVGDSMAYAFRWIGVQSPATGWLLLGAVAGAALGAFIGMRRGGRPVPAGGRRALWFAGAATFLAAGSNAPGAPALTSAPTERADARPRVRVLSDGLNMRARPNAKAMLLTTLPRNAVLTVLAQSEAGSWYQVETMRNGRPVTGWVSSARVSRPTGDVQITGVSPRRPSTRPSPGDDANRDSDPSSTPPPAVAARPVASRDSAAGTVEPPAVPPVPAAPAEQSAADAADVALSPAAVAEVRRHLAAARAHAAGGDFAAALRALTAADEAVRIEAAESGSSASVAALGREAAAVRQTIVVDCRERARLAAGGYGGGVPRCE